MLVYVLSIAFTESAELSKHAQQSLKHLLVRPLQKKLNILDSEVRRAESAREVHGVPLSVLLEGTQEQFLPTVFTKVDI